MLHVGCGSNGPPLAPLPWRAAPPLCPPAPPPLQWPTRLELQLRHHHGDVGEVQDLGAVAEHLQAGRRQARGEGRGSRGAMDASLGLEVVVPATSG